MPERRLTRRDTLRLIALAAAAAALIAWLPWLGPLAYPFRLLSTLIHELSHGLAALATGGHFQRLVIFPDGAGLAYTAGGWRLLVIPAGYLGSAAFGAGLILLGPSPRASRWALGVVGLLVGALSLRYGLPSLVTEHALGGLLAVVAGTALGLACLALATRANERWVVFTLHLLAIEVALAALADLWTLIGLSGLAAGPVTDARSMAAITLLPPLFWALFWALLAGVLVVGAIRLAWFSAAEEAQIRGPSAST
jgi:hypothetical protein